MVTPRQEVSPLLRLKFIKHAKHRVPVDSNQWPMIAFGWNNRKLFENIRVSKLRDEYGDELDVIIEPCIASLRRILEKRMEKYT